MSPETVVALVRTLRSMIEPTAALARHASTCTILPRSDDFSSLYINLTGLTEVEPFAAAGTLLDGGDSDAAWQLLRPPRDGGA